MSRFSNPMYLYLGLCLILMVLPFSSAFGLSSPKDSLGQEPPTYYVKGQTSTADAEASFLLQIAASNNWTAANNLADFHSRYVPTFIVTIEGDELPYKLLIGNFSSWADCRQFKEDHQSRIPADSFIIYPYTHTMKQLVPFQD